MWVKRVNILLLLFLMTGLTNLFGQRTVDLADISFHLTPGQTREFYYGFAKGDTLWFDFEEVNEDDLSSVSIGEIHAVSPRFTAVRTDLIEDKAIPVEQTGIFRFTFYNGDTSGRECQFYLRRVPGNDSLKAFNSAVVWKEFTDTSWMEKTERYLVRTDTLITNVTDRIVKVHSRGHVHGNKTSFNFTLPPGTVAWSYYIGVDQAGIQAFEQALSELRKHSLTLFLKYTEYGPLAALTLGGASYLTYIKAGEDIDYYLVSRQNESLFLKNQPFKFLKKGRVVNDFSKMNKPLSGTYYFCLSNDNAAAGVQVMVKITAVSVKQVWGTRSVRQFEVKRRSEPFLQAN